jgi:hypothetical protein
VLFHTFNSNNPPGVSTFQDGVCPFMYVSSTNPDQACLRWFAVFRSNKPAPPTSLHQNKVHRENGAERATRVIW